MDTTVTIRFTPGAVYLMRMQQVVPPPAQVTRRRLLMGFTFPTIKAYQELKHSHLLQLRQI